jgi:hypothetical protein
VGGLLASMEHALLGVHGSHQELRPPEIDADGDPRAHAGVPFANDAMRQY